MPARSSRALCVVLFILAVPVHLAAQQDRSPGTKETATVQSLDGKLVDRLPVDRLREAAILLPGVVSGENGGVSLRGGRVEDVAIYLDGIPVSPGYRKSAIGFDPASIPGPAQSFLDIGTNSLASMEVVTGPLNSAFGRGQAGVIRLTTPTPGDRLDARGSFESDRPFGSQHGPGLNRLQGLAGGRLVNRLRVFAAATVEGRASAESGPGAENEPLFRGVGVDTVVAVPSQLNDPFADTVFVNVSRFAIARGRCDEFSGSANPDIADNYGQECQGVRIPATGRSNYQLLGRLDYEAGVHTSLWLSGMASRDQVRYVAPNVVSLPLAGFKGTSRALTLGARHGLSLSGRPMTLNLALSLQRDATVGGPLSPASERDTRDGFFLSGLEFLYDPESFPVNSELVRNIRENIPGSRRSPLDLENTNQYSLINRYRNSAYGLDGGPESGGPSGRLMFLKENRTVGSGSVAWQYHRLHSIRAGAEFTRYGLAGYSHDLTSQAFSDAFIANPVQSAIYVEDQVHAGNFTIIAGARYDRFSSDAERPFVLDTVGSSPRFNTYSYFPIPNSYGNGGITFNGRPLVKFVPDEARSAVSPRIQVAFALNRGTTIRLGVARQSQMPDLSLVLSGVNTDLRVTNTNHVYGGDLDLERTTLYEIGIQREIDRRFTLDASVYTRELDDQAVALLQPFRDPARFGELVDIRQVTSLGLGRVRGFDARIDIRAGILTGILGYAYQKSERELGDNVPGGGSTPLENSRPHTLTAGWALEAPRNGGRGLVNSLIRNAAVYGSFRFTSGTAYTRCAAESGNESILSGEICATTFEGKFFGSRLPSTKYFDLRVTRGFTVAGRELVAYLDGRNILNFENVLQVYAVNGKTSNPAEASQVYSQDSAGFADVGVANGIRQANGDLDFNFNGMVASGCANFVNSTFTPAAPDCVYLIRAEERFGDGDHVFTLAEQRHASEAAYNTVRGRSTFLGAPRRLRIGLEVRF